MKNLWTSFRKLSLRQKVAVAALAAVILLTWLAVCLVLVIPAA